MIITNKVFFPAVLSYMQPSTDAILRIDRRAEIFKNARVWRALTWFAKRPGALIVLCLSVPVLAVSLVEGDRLTVGDADVGAPEFWRDSEYNRNVSLIEGKFSFNTDELMVIAEFPESGCTDFVNLYWADRLHGYLSDLPEVASVRSLAQEIRIRNVGNSEGHPRFFEIPRDPYALSSAMGRLELGQRLFNANCTAVPMRMFLKDHRATTLREAASAVESFAAQEQEMREVRFNLAAGSAGVMLATNEAVEDARTEMLLVLYAFVGILVYLTLFSWRAALCVLIPLVIVSQFAEAVMVWLNIGLKVSTLPVLALGAGVGVDYGIYLLHRIKAEWGEAVSFPEACLRGLQTAGTAVVFTAITMTAGVAAWMFSPLKFQADMGILLAYMFFVNMIGTIVLVPALRWLLLNNRSPARPPGAAVGESCAVVRAGSPSE